MAAREAELDAAIIAAGTDYQRLAELSTAYETLRAEREDLETQWLEAAEGME